MRKTGYYIAIIVSMLLMSSCENLLEPRKDNRLTEEEVLGNPEFAEGILLNAYIALADSYSPSSDEATDNAATNSLGSGFLRMATGEWKSTYNPLSAWNYAYNQIYYINLFLENYEDVEWSWRNEDVHEYYLQRFKGEAHGLRAMYEFELLKAHAGISVDNQLLGYPIVEESLTKDDEFKLPRDTYQECVNHILADCDIAIQNLPPRYEDTEDFVYNEVFGSSFVNRMNGYAAMALRSRVTLHAASPAFTESLSAADIQARWEAAASSAGELLDQAGGLAAVSPTGLRFYLSEITNYDPDIIWHTTHESNRSFENANYPPSLFGNGNTNPSQNLVDAFPMQNGYPISDVANSGYDPANPYVGRDPRLAEYIIYNGSILRGTPIFTASGLTKDGINASTESTRTGYYVKKFVNPKVNLNPISPNDANHFYTYFRFTEVFLNYAEAANEAWGPDGDPMGYGFTSKDVIGAIRERAGIAQPDNYLAGISTIEEMRTLIHNERRLELCFEESRFWDIRRWKYALTEPVKGVFISGTSYDYQTVENRDYLPHMIYGPIPYNETLLYDLKQNQGW